MQSEPHSGSADAARLERVNRLYAVLSRVNEAIIRTRDRQELLDAACRIAVEHGGFVLAWIGFIDDETGLVRVAARYGRDEGYLDTIRVSLDPDVPEGQCPTAVSLRECRAVVDNDAANDRHAARWRDRESAHGLAASASFPLMVSGRCAGVITLYAPRAGYFDDEEVVLLNALADDFSFALESVEVAKQREEAVEELRRSRDDLEERVEERTEQLRSSGERFELLSEANSLLLSTDDPEAVIQTIAEKAMRHLKADVFFNYVLDPGAERLRLNAWGGVDERVAKAIARLEMGQAICGCVARDGERIISEDVQHNGDERADLVRRMGVRCYACHPLRSGDATVGTLSFGTKRKDCFADDEIELMRTLANQLSIAMERVHAEERVRRSAEELGATSQRLALERQRLATLLDTLPIGVFITDAKGGIVYANEQAAEIWGGVEIVESADEYGSYKGWWHDTGERLSAKDWSGAKALQGATVIGDLIDIERPDGMRATLLNSSAPVRDPDGTVVGQVTVDVDVSERIREQRELEHALEEQKSLAERLRASLEEQSRLAASLDREREQLRAVLDNMAEGVAIVYPDGSLDMNPAQARLDRFPASEGSRRNLSDFDGSEVYDAEGRLCSSDEWPLARVLRGERFSEALYEISAPGRGVSFVAAFSGVPVRDERGELLFGVITAREVTEQRRREQELEFQSFLLESVSDSVIVYYPDEPDTGKLVYVNEAAWTARGYTRDEMLRLNVTDLIAPSWRDRLRQRLDKVARGEEVRAESEHVRKDGTTFPVEVWLRQVEFGGRHLVVNVSRDISVSKRAEAGLKRALDDTSLLQDVAQAATSALELDTVAGHMLEAVQRRLGLQAGDVRLLTDDGTKLCLLASVGWPEETKRRLAEVAVADSGWMASRVVRDRSVLTHQDEEAPTPEREGVLREAGVLESRYIALPLVYAGEVLGMMSLTFPGRRPFGSRERELFAAVARTVAQAVQNARLYQAEQAELARRSVLQGVAGAAASSLDAAELSRRVLDRVRSAMRAVVGSVHLLVRGGEEGEHVASFGYPSRELERIRTFHVDETTLAGNAVLTGRPQTAGVDEAPTESRQRQKRLDMMDNRLIALPLRVRGEIVGVLGLGFVGRRSFTPAEVDLYSAVADQLSVGLENARLFEAERSTAERLALELETTGALLEAADAIGQWADLDKLSRAIAETVLGAVGHARVSLVLWDEELRQATVAASAGREPLAPGISFPVGDLSTPVREAVDGEPTAAVVDYDALEGAEKGTAAGSMELHLALLVPLRQRDRSLGALMVNDPGERVPFTDREIDLVSGIAAQAAVAIENARLFEAQQRRRRRIEALHGVMEAAVASLDLQGSAQAMLDYLAREHGFQLANLWLRKGDALELVACVGYPETYRERFSPMPMSAPLDAIKVYTSGQPAVVPDAGRANPAVREMYADIGVQLGAYVILPLVSRGKVIGTLHFGWHEPRAVNAYDVDFYHSIGDEVGVVIENVELFEAEHTSARLGAALADIDATIHSSLDFDHIATRALDAGARAIGAESGAIDGLVEGGWEVWYEYGFERSILGDRFTNEQNPHGVLAVETGQPVAIDDAFTDPRVDNETMKAYGLRSAIVAPLIVRGRPIAGLYYNFSSVYHHFSEQEIDFVRRLASSLSLAMENARLFEAEREAAELGVRLSEIDELLHSTLDLDEMAERAVKAVAEAVGADTAGVSLLEGDDLVLRYRYGTGLAQERGSRLTLQQARFVTAALESEEPLWASDTETDERVDLETMRSLGVRAAVRQRLFAGGRPIGVIALNYRRPRRFSSHLLDFVHRVGVTLSLAMENARLYQTEHDIADRLQEALLALPERVPGIEFAHEYHSAAEAARVGGDFYDLFELDDAHVGVVIGDVAGKGLNAAVLTSMVKNTIRAHANESGKTPSRILELTNDVVFKGTSTEAFVTVFFGVLDRRDGTLVYGNAGHTTAVISGPRGKVTRLEATGPLLGAFAGVAFEQAEAALEPDELLFLYTDGLTEARRDSEQYGEQRLFVFLGSTNGASASRVVEAVIEDVVRFSGDRLRDDLAILALKRSP